MALNWERPYEVTTQGSPLTYGPTRLSTNEQSEHVHATDLKAYVLRDQDAMNEALRKDMGSVPL